MKFLSGKIIVSFILLGILLAPVTPVLQQNQLENKLFNVNTARAQGDTQIKFQLQEKLKKIKFDVTYASPNLIFKVKIPEEDKEIYKIFLKENTLRVAIIPNQNISLSVPNAIIDVPLPKYDFTNLNEESVSIDTTWSMTNQGLVKGTSYRYIFYTPFDEDSLTQVLNLTTPLANGISFFLGDYAGYNLANGTTGLIDWIVNSMSQAMVSIVTMFKGKKILFAVTNSFKIEQTSNTLTTSFTETIDGKGIVAEQSFYNMPAMLSDITLPTSWKPAENYNFECGIGIFPSWIAGDGTIGGCVAALFYLFWQVSYWVAYLGGIFMDFFIYYSTDSESYKSTFVENGWGIIRDISNIFFIIVLMYIAVKTVLGLNVSNNKKLIGMVIIVALTINFSLFITKVVIDSGNILAKVFYNNITVTGNNATGIKGEKSLSTALISKFNPQGIISREKYEDHNGIPTFIFVTGLLIFISLYTAYIFFSVALLFVARTISLWLLMVFSPIAFISFATPFDIPKFNHKEWTKGLIENAMLAPVFIFFMYIIIMFLQAGLGIGYEGKTLMQEVMKTTIPFIAIVILLRSAKEIAKKFSGEMGAMINKAGATIGGLALGGVAGLGAKALVGTVGKVASGLGKEGGALHSLAYTKNAEGKIVSRKGLGGWAGRMAIKGSTGASKSSFDIRSSPIGTLIGKAGLDLNKSKMIGLGTDTTKGGYKGMVEKKEKKIITEFNSIKSTKSDDEMKIWSEGKYNTTNEYNADLLEDYKNNIGKNSLLYSLAYSTADASGKLVNESNYTNNKNYTNNEEKWSEEWEENKAKERALKGTSFDEDAYNKTKDKFMVEKTNEKTIGKIKVAIGAASAVVTGVATGGFGAFASAAGAAPVATAAGSGILAGNIYGSYSSKKDAEKGATKKIEKDIKKQRKSIAELNRIKKRIEELESLLNELEDNLPQDTTLSDHIRSELLNVKDKIEDLRENAKNIKTEKIKVAEKLSSIPPGVISAERASLRDKLAEYEQKENNIKNDLMKLNTKKYRYESARNAEQELSTLKNREDVVSEYLAGKSTEKTDKKVEKNKKPHEENEEKTPNSHSANSKKESKEDHSDH